jgi:ferredoxin-NADP reductase
MEHTIIKIKSIEEVTHDVIRIVASKPAGFNFVPGQAAELSINKSVWVKEKRPFTFTSLPDLDFLEFTIKIYPEHDGVTKEMLNLKTGDELLLHEVFGAITYQGEGVFIAGGAGVTPFISILRDLKAKNEIGDNMLVFANKTKADIILEKEFQELLDDSFINILSEEEIEGYHHGRITKDFLQNILVNLNQHFYLCGPPPMIEAVENQLVELGVDKKFIVKELF